MPAFKLSKDEITRRDSYVTDLNVAASALDDQVRVYNEAVAELRKPVEAALEAYNDALEEARGFINDIAEAADNAIDEKSEKWQEGDKGQAAATYRDAWQDIDLDPFEVAWPDELELDAPTHADEIDALPSEAE